jgi:ketosteroid isomerase-like protein
LHVPIPFDPSNPTKWADDFISAIIGERIAEVISGYDPSDDTYVFLEGPRWSTKTGERVAFGWEAFLNSPIRMVSHSWSEGPFAVVEGSMAWIAGVVDLSVRVGDRDMNIRLRGTYVLREHQPGTWGIVHEHFSQPLADPYAMGDWLSFAPESS